MTLTNIDNIAHQETIDRGFLQDFGDDDRTLTYRIDSEGRLKCTEFYNEGSCLNKEREINSNPLYERLAGAAMEIGISLGIGAFMGLIAGESAPHDLNYGLSALDYGVIMGTYSTLCIYLFNLPKMSYFHKNNAADRNAWKKFKQFKQTSPQ